MQTARGERLKGGPINGILIGRSATANITRPSTGLNSLDGNISHVNGSNSRFKLVKMQGAGATSSNSQAAS